MAHRRVKTRRPDRCRLPFPALFAAAALLLGQASLPILQSLHERLETASGGRFSAVYADLCPDRGSDSIPDHGTPAQHDHDESTCSICQTIQAVRQSFFLPPPVAVAVLELRPEPAPGPETLAAPATPALFSGSARGPPRA